ncbi:hypothetical protein BJX70DRAFT_131217 [Aspergillus crustosus]
MFLTFFLFLLIDWFLLNALKATYTNELNVKMLTCPPPLHLAAPLCLPRNKGMLIFNFFFRTSEDTVCSGFRHEM